MNIKKIFYSTLVVVFIFGLSIFSANTVLAALTISKVEGCERVALTNCTSNKAIAGQVLVVTGVGFRSGDRVSLSMSGYDGTIPYGDDYTDTQMIISVPPDASSGNHNITFAVLKKSSSGSFSVLSSKAFVVQIVSSGQTSTGETPVDNTTPASGTDFCAQTKIRYGSDYAKWPTIKVGLNNDATAVKCAKSLVMKVAPAWELDVNDGNYSEEDAGAITYIQSIQNPPLKDDGIIGKATWPALFAGKFGSSTPTGSTTNNECAAGQHPDYGTGLCVDDVPGSSNKNTPSGLCGFLGEGYQEKNGLCFPPEVVKGSNGSIVASDSIGTLIRNIMRILLTLAGALAVLFIVIGSVMYTTAEGNEGRAKQGKAIITRAIIGLVGAALAYTIVTIVYNLLTSGSVFSG